MPEESAPPSDLAVGSWLHSRGHGEMVRVLECQTLWGHTTCQVWVPSKERVEWVGADSLHAAAEARENTLDRIVHAACAVKVGDALAQDVLLAPLEAGVIPLPHQIIALSRAVSGGQVRYLLADEVGLGKTIEAGLILRELKLRGLVQRVLVVAPKGLVTQWVQEMRTHFGEDLQPIQPSSFSAVRELLGEENVWRRFDQVICPLDSVKPVERRRGWSRERIERHNQERIGDLIAAGWDLIIVDEAHRLGGSTEQVARHKLGRALSEAAPYVLLLTATPHQGRTEAFHRLVSLLDRDAFPDLGSVKREKVAPFVIRTEKRRAIDDRGDPLFQPRSTRLIPVCWGDRHASQRQLYEAVTEYVREGYNQAIRENRQYLGFLMLLMQRLVTSSTRAIATALQKRLDVLRHAAGVPEEEDDNDADWYDQDGQEQLETLASSRIAGIRNEVEEVRALLDLAQRCEAQGPDVRAECLLDLLYSTQREESDPDLRFLIFTEFVPTQEMLSEFLGHHGFPVVCLNGSMSMEERQRAQRRFSEDMRVMVSTDAGGEGLNLQFAHVVANYDLPWNPMRIEQRIGRVDRIGQTHPVRAFNLIFEDSVELRVHEVLEEKLLTIHEEFGVDKTGDVLDSAEGGAAFERAFAKAILNPDEINESVDELLRQVRERAEEEAVGRSMYETQPLDPQVARQVREHPVQFWIERMTTSYLRAEGGKAERDLLGWNLTWADGMDMSGVTFVGREAVERGLTHLGFQDPRVRAPMEALPRVTPHAPVLTFRVPGLPAGVAGYWGLWQVVLRDSDAEQVRALPLFCHDDGRTLLPTARVIWDRFVEGMSGCHELAPVDDEAAQPALDRLRTEAERHGQALFEDLVGKRRERLRLERQKGEYAFRVRREALNRIGLPEVRDYRLRRLEEEQRRWEIGLRRRESVFPELRAVLALRVESSDG